MLETPEYDTATVDIAEITFFGRIRKELGGINELAEDIKIRGLINPVTLMTSDKSKYILIAGLRRLEACKKLGMTTIRASVLSPLAADEALTMEYAENVHRKDFTVTERLDYAEKIKIIEQAKANERKSLYARSGYEDKIQDVHDCAHPEKGRTRVVVAKKAGFTSYGQYERAVVVANERPDFLTKIDAGEMTIYNAYMKIKDADANKNELENVSPDIENTISNNTETNINEPVAPVHEYISDEKNLSKGVSLSRCDEERTQSKNKTSESKQHSDKTCHVDDVAHARHDRLMRNSLYVDLYERCDQLSREVNMVKVQSNIRAEGYEKRIRCYEDNISALRKRCDMLESENTELHHRLVENAEEESMT